jgi:hypothetical protein
VEYEQISENIFGLDVRYDVNPMQRQEPPVGDDWPDSIDQCSVEMSISRNGIEICHEQIFAPDFSLALAGAKMKAEIFANALLAPNTPASESPLRTKRLETRKKRRETWLISASAQWKPEPQPEPQPEPDPGTVTPEDIAEKR